MFTLSLEGFSSPVASPTNRPRTLLLNAFSSGSSLPFNIPTFKPSNLQTTNLDAASSISPLFATLTKNTRGGSTPQSKLLSFRNLTTRHSLLSTISFTIRTYQKRASNPFGIRTSKTRDLNSFRICTYKKTPRGVGAPLHRSQWDSQSWLSSYTLIFHASRNPGSSGRLTSRTSIEPRCSSTQNRRASGAPGLISSA